MKQKIELLSDLKTSLNQLGKGERISHQKAKEKLLKRVPKCKSCGRPLLSGGHRKKSITSIETNHWPQINGFLHFC
jgi:hypothetical protein